MSETVKKPIKITETVLRDSHQSLIATRMPTELMLPILETMDQVGYHSLECWGGATFDASLRFLKEDPWSRLRKIRDKVKNTKLQMLFRGQNILGYRHYADDVVTEFVEKSIANGIDIIRIFDCFNDLRNLQCAVNAANTVKKREGRGEAQIALSYTLGDAYTLEYWMKMAKSIEEMGADSICIKDMAGLLVPYKAEELIKAMKSATRLPIQLHTHYTSGVASMTYLKAVEAGVDVIDCAISPFALGTSQPATEVMVETFKGTPYDTGFDQNLLAKIADHFRPYREECLKSGLLNPKVLGVDIKTLMYQVPGGMLSNMVSQLKDRMQRISITMCFRKSQGFVRIWVSRLLLHLHRRLSVRRRCSMYLWVSGIRWLPRRQRLFSMANMDRQSSRLTRKYRIRFFQQKRRLQLSHAVRLISFRMS